MNFFLKKQLTKYSSTYQSLLFCKILKIFLELSMSPFHNQNDQFVFNNFFLYKPLVLLSSTYQLFSLCKIFKKFLLLIWSYEDPPFLDPKWSICPKKKFEKKNIIFIYLLASFIVQNLKQFLQQIQSYEDAPFLDPKWPICPNQNFFRRPVKKPCSFNSCLNAKNQSQILVY